MNDFKSQAEKFTQYRKAVSATSTNLGTAVRPEDFVFFGSGYGVQAAHMMAISRVTGKSDAGELLEILRAIRVEAHSLVRDGTLNSDSLEPCVAALVAGYQP